MQVPLWMALLWLPATLAASIWAVRCSIAYAYRRGMLDHPGQRRSHRIATARGGGIGIVLACLIAMPLALVSFSRPWPSALALTMAIALIMLSAIGWCDDHRSLRVLPRLAVQLLAIGLFSAALLSHGRSWLWMPLLVLAGTWSVNLHNFMDGIDGLLAQQAIFVGASLALLALSVAQMALAVAAASLAVASLGFWVYNRSPARIFMGDVGSGSIGLLIFTLIAMLWWTDLRLLWPGLILCSCFIADASLTLLSRLLRGRRWYAAHREHLYQWLVRYRYTHAQAAAFYLFWNVTIALPAACLARVYPVLALPVCLTVYALAVATWIGTKRRCVRRDLLKARHVVT